MKKLSILLSALAIVGLASCETDDTPVVNVPDSFTLNTPPTAEQYYELTPEGTITLSCSQPDYGFVAAAIYSTEISLDKQSTYAIDSNTPTSASFTINEADVATGMCKLRGIETSDQWTDPCYQPLYIRAVAKLDNAGTGLVKSNWIELKNVKGYFAVPEPGYIWLVGTPSEWKMEETETLKNWRLKESDKAIGSKIYSGVFNIPAAAMFRFYTVLDGNWDTGSIGPCNNHGGNTVDSDGAQNVECEFINGVFEDGIKSTKDNFNFVNWPGGEVTIVVDMSNEDSSKWTVTMTAGAQEVVPIAKVYMIGNQENWATPSVDTYATWALVDEGITGVYTATFDFSAFADGFPDGNTQLFCRFYKNPTGWGAAEWSSGADNVDVTPGVAYPTAAGEGCFVLPDAAGKNVTVTLDTNNNEVTFTINN